jgi:hypothetical protein
MASTKSAIASYALGRLVGCAADTDCRQVVAELDDVVSLCAREGVETVRQCRDGDAFGVNRAQYASPPRSGQRAQHTRPKQLQYCDQEVRIDQEARSLSFI